MDSDGSGRLVPKLSPGPFCRPLVELLSLEKPATEPGPELQLPVLTEISHTLRSPIIPRECERPWETIPKQ